MNLLIPSQIKVGFQNRADCYTKQLGYVIYYDTKGKLRKEVSWEGWRDKTIEPKEFENAPIDGFVINKGVQRSGEWFGSGRSLVRVYDPRGFEFEVSIENLIQILMHTDCVKRDLLGKFVYAWEGKELVLLPVESEEYKRGQDYTGGLNKTVKKKELKEGFVYKTKKGEEVIYLGFYKIYNVLKSWYFESCLYDGENADLSSLDNEYHIFFNPKTQYDYYKYIQLRCLGSLRERISDSPVDNYSELRDNLIKKYNLYPSKEIIFRKVDNAESFLDSLIKMVVSLSKTFNSFNLIHGISNSYKATIIQIYKRGNDGECDYSILDFSDFIIQNNQIVPLGKRGHYGYQPSVKIDKEKVLSLIKESYLMYNVLENGEEILLNYE